MSVEDSGPASGIVEPGLFGLILFGFSLATVGSFDFLGKGEGAIVLGFLVGGLGETFAGVWKIRRGESYLGTVMTTFGIWLVGLFLLMTLGDVIHIMTPMALAVYFLALLVPVALLYIPTITRSLGWKMHLAFVMLFILVLFTGVHFLVESHIVEWVAGGSAYLAAVGIWGLAYDDIMAL